VGLSKRFVAAGVAALLVSAAGGAAIAGGQGESGPPTGTLSFKVRVHFKKERLHGINPAVPRNKKRPKVADMTAENAQVLSTDGQRIGRVHNFDITTFEGAKKYKGKAVSIGNAVVDFGAGDMLFAQCVREDSPTNNNCAIIGGTGRYSGARGTAVEDFNGAVEDKQAGTFTLPINVTFIP
jgi:hypothetical protein